MIALFCYCTIHILCSYSLTICRTTTHTQILYTNYENVLKRQWEARNGRSAKLKHAIRLQELDKPIFDANDTFEPYENVFVLHVCLFQRHDYWIETSAAHTSNKSEEKVVCFFFIFHYFYYYSRHWLVLCTHMGNSKCFSQYGIVAFHATIKCPYSRQRIRIYARRKRKSKHI